MIKHPSSLMAKAPVFIPGNRQLLHNDIRMAVFLSFWLKKPFSLC